MIKNLKYMIQHFVCQKNFRKKLEQIKSYPDKQKIRVLFLIRENSKWTYDSIYNEMLNSESFEPIIVVSLLGGVVKGKDKTRNDLEISYNFFKKRNYNVIKAIEDNEYIDLKTFKPDIVFYDQPWELPEIHSPCRVSYFALTAYCPYSVELFNYKENYKKNFHFLLWCYFVDNKLNLERFRSYSAKNVDNCQTLGYPKLDVYVKQNKIKKDFWTNSTKTKIIYAPHHSFKNSSLKLATFMENGKFILDYAKTHSESTEWVFKPHPNLKYALLKDNLMTQDEIKNYYREWEEIGKIYTEGDYFDIFKTSDLMLTDCASFLCEYLLTGKPIVQLENKEHCSFNSLGQLITSYNYKAHTCKDIEDILAELIIKKNDYNKENRLKLVDEIIDRQEPSASKICQYLLNEVFRGEK